MAVRTRSNYDRYIRAFFRMMLTVADDLQADIARNRDALVVYMPVHKVESAFAVSLRRFVSPDGKNP